MSDKNNPDKQVDAVIRSLESPEDRKNREDHEKKFREIFISKKSEYKPPDFLAGGREMMTGSTDELMEQLERVSREREEQEMMLETYLLALGEI